jgi:hypothetical protein
VANHGIGAWFAAKEGNPVPAILHWPSPCSLRRIFSMRDFTRVKPRCGGLFRPKLTTNGHSLHFILWHYPFQIKQLLELRNVSHNLICLL